jgi:hypothetical protein
VDYTVGGGGGWSWSPRRLMAEAAPGAAAGGAAAPAPLPAAPPALRAQFSVADDVHALLAYRRVAAAGLGGRGLWRRALDAAQGRGQLLHISCPQALRARLKKVLLKPRCPPSGCC